RRRSRLIAVCCAVRGRPTDWPALVARPQRRQSTVHDTPVAGLYDSLLTQQLQRQVELWRQTGHLIETEQVDNEEVAHLLGRFVGQVAARTFASLKTPDEQIQLANEVLRRLAEHEVLADGPSRLLSIVKEEPGAANP